MQVAVEVPQVSQRAAVGVDTGFKQGYGDAGDQSHGQERHLESRVEQQVGIEDEKAERSRGDHVQRAALAVQQTRGEVRAEHPGGAGDRQARANERGIGGNGKRRDQRPRYRRHEHQS